MNRQAFLRFSNCDSDLDLWRKKKKKFITLYDEDGFIVRSPRLSVGFLKTIVSPLPMNVFLRPCSIRTFPFKSDDDDILRVELDGE